MSKTVYRYNGSSYSVNASGGQSHRGVNNTVICLVITVVVLAIVCISMNLLITRSSEKNGSLSGEYNANSVYEPISTSPDTTAGDGDESSGSIPTHGAPSALKLFGDEKTATLGGLVQSEYAIVIDGNTGHILASKNSTKKIYPASLTKVMSAIVAYEYMQNNNVDIMSTYLSVSQAIIDYTYKEGASNAGFKLGEQVRMYDVFCGVIVPSGADATLMLAEFCYGSEKAFVDMMNNKANEMGLSNTHFVTSTGLHDNDHYTTVRDLAVILDYACNYDFLKEIMGFTSYRYPKTNLSDERTSTSTLYRWRVNQYSSNLSKSGVTGATAFGGKSGYTPEAKCCLYTFALDDNGNEYIAVTCSANSGKVAVTDYLTLYNRYCKFG